MTGVLHRTWIDIKNSFTPENRVISTLEDVVYGEKAAIEAYQKALESEDLHEDDIRVISDHLHNLKGSYQQFKKIEEYKKKE